MELSICVRYVHDETCVQRGCVDIVCVLACMCVYKCVAYSICNVRAWHVYSISVCGLWGRWGVSEQCMHALALG